MASTSCINVNATVGVRAAGNHERVNVQTYSSRFRNLHAFPINFCPRRAVSSTFDVLKLKRLGPIMRAVHECRGHASMKSSAQAASQSAAEGAADT
jgi:hypothetical protein